MECHSVRQKATASPVDRRYCVELVLFLPIIHTQPLMASTSGHWREVHSLGLVTLGTSENQVGSDPLVAVTASLTTPLARMCYAYQQLHDIGN